MIDIHIADEQSALSVDGARLEQAARLVLEQHGPARAEVSIAVVDDLTIHELNRRYLQHDYPTDVLSFVLEADLQQLEGEVIVSADTAISQGRQYGVRPEDELLLYVIHGVLHLVGFDDTSAELRQRMRCAERSYLEQFGVDLQERPVADVNRTDADSLSGDGSR